MFLEESGVAVALLLVLNSNVPADVVGPPPSTCNAQSGGGGRGGGALRYARGEEVGARAHAGCVCWPVEMSLEESSDGERERVSYAPGPRPGGRALTCLPLMGVRTIREVCVAASRSRSESAARACCSSSDWAILLFS